MQPSGTIRPVALPDLSIGIADLIPCLAFHLNIERDEQPSRARRVLQLGQ